MFTLSNNFVGYSIKVLGELALDILFFPLWWYTRGLFSTLKFLYGFLSNRQKSLALLVWIKNIHKPMFGQTDWQGKLISFFMRLIQIIIRSIVMLFWAVFALAVLLFWISLPVLALYQILFQVV